MQQRIGSRRAIICGCGRRRRVVELVVVVVLERVVRVVRVVAVSVTGVAMMSVCVVVVRERGHGRRGRRHASEVLFPGSRGTGRGC